MTSIDGGTATGLALADVEENGFAGALPAALVENGFEKGFAGADVPAPFVAPNNDAPILNCGFSSSTTFDFSGFACALLLEPVATRTPRIPRILPSFLRQVFLRQVQIYSLRSCPGKCCGRAPLSSRRRLSRPLHTLHFASAPEGAVLSSIHAYPLSVSGVVVFRQPTGEPPR